MAFFGGRHGGGSGRSRPERTGQVRDQRGVPAPVGVPPAGGGVPPAAAPAPPPKTPGRAGAPISLPPSADSGAPGGSRVPRKQRPATPVQLQRPGVGGAVGAGRGQAFRSAQIGGFSPRLRTIEEALAQGPGGARLAAGQGIGTLPLNAGPSVAGPVPTTPKRFEDELRLLGIIQSLKG